MNGHKKYINLNKGRSKLKVQHSNTELIEPAVICFLEILQNPVIFNERYYMIVNT